VLQNLEFLFDFNESFFVMAQAKTII